MVMPSIPYPEYGAEQIDRACGIRQLKRLGYDVRVIAKTNEWQTQEFVRNVEAILGVPIIGIPYLYSNKVLSTKERLLKFFGRFRSPLYFDGAAFEYSDPNMQSAVTAEADRWKPDIMWFEYTYLWPLYHIARTRNIRIITRSANIEPQHFLDENGRTILNYFKYFPKFIGERLSIRWSDIVFSITPRDKATYDQMRLSKVINLPLRGLPLCINTVSTIREQKPLKVFFMGSTYTVQHNKKALEMVITDIAPRILVDDPQSFVFYILGRKFPTEFDRYLRDNVIVKGYVEDLHLFLEEMDIALIPSLFGSGMQQKIFEPLAMGIPTLTSSRGIANYPFYEGESVLFGSDGRDFVSQLMKMKDIEYRRELSMNAKQIAKKIFSQEALDIIVRDSIENLFAKKP